MKKPMIQSLLLALLTMCLASQVSAIRGENEADLAEYFANKNKPKAPPPKNVYKSKYKDIDDHQLTTYVLKMEELIWDCYNQTQNFLDKPLPKQIEKDKNLKDLEAEDTNPNKEPPIDIALEKSIVRGNLTYLMPIFLKTAPGITMSKELKGEFRRFVLKKFGEPENKAFRRDARKILKLIETKRNYKFYIPY